MVDADVRAQIAGADEFPIADIAFVRFFPRVGENVRLQISGGCERLGALLALVRTFAGVDTNVSS